MINDNCLVLHENSDINIYAFNKDIPNKTSLLNPEIEICENKNYPQCHNINYNNTGMQIDYDHDNDIDNITTENKSRSYNDVDNDNKFKNDLITWALSYNINHNACNALIKILQQYTSCNFPKDIRTLLQTPRQVNVIDACGGQYFYAGLNNVIKKIFLKSKEKDINLLINIDGLPISKSSQSSL